MSQSVRVLNWCGTFPPVVSHLPTFSRVPRGRPGRGAFGRGARRARSLVPRFSSPAVLLPRASLPPPGIPRRFSRAEIVLRWAQTSASPRFAPQGLITKLLCAFFYRPWGGWGLRFFHRSVGSSVVLCACARSARAFAVRPVAAIPSGEIRSSGAPLRLVASLCAGAWSRRSCFVATPSQLRRSSAPLNFCWGSSAGAVRSWWLGCCPDPRARAPGIWNSRFFFLSLPNNLKIYCLCTYLSRFSSFFSAGYGCCWRWSLCCYSSGFGSVKAR